MIHEPATSLPSIPLGDLASIDRNGVAPESISDGALYVGLEHIDGEGQFVDVRPVTAGMLASTKFRFGPRHILYGKLRPYLRKTARPDFEGICSTDILPILPGPNVDRDYLFHYLRHPRVVEFVTSRCEGANLPRLNPRQLESLMVPIPFRDEPTKSLGEQRRIAAVLDKAHSIQGKRRDAISITEELIPSLFDDSFRKWLGEPAAGMPQLGDPELAEVVSGVTKGRHFNGQPTVTVPYIRVANVQDGYLDLSEVKSIEALPSDVQSLHLQRGDVLMTEGGDFDKLGRGAMYEADIPDCIHQNHVFRVRCNRSRLLPIYFATYIRTPMAKAYFLKCAKKTSNLASINMTQLRALPVACPPIDLQKRFAKEVEVIHRVKRQQVELAGHADDLFASLVQRAFRGQL